jgi:hypothetical protein
MTNEDHMALEYDVTQNKGVIRRGVMTNIIQFQQGLIPEGEEENGCFTEDVITVLIMRLSVQNVGELRCRENSLAITHLEEALNWLERRTSNRRLQGVENTMHGHRQLGGNTSHEGP